jgi:hypothetical protein
LFFFCFFRNHLYEAKLQRIAARVREVLGQPDMEFPRNKDGKMKIAAKYFDDPRFGLDRIVHQKNFDKFTNYSMKKPWIIYEKLSIELLEEDNLTKGNAVILHASAMTMHYINESKLSAIDRLCLYR